MYAEIANSDSPRQQLQGLGLRDVQAILDLSTTIAGRSDGVKGDLPETKDEAIGQVIETLDRLEALFSTGRISVQDVGITEFLEATGGENAAGKSYAAGSVRQPSSERSENRREGGDAKLSQRKKHYVTPAQMNRLMQRKDGTETYQEIVDVVAALLKDSRRYIDLGDEERLVTDVFTYARKGTNTVLYMDPAAKDFLMAELGVLPMVPDERSHWLTLTEMNNNLRNIRDPAKDKHYRQELYDFVEGLLEESAFLPVLEDVGNRRIEDFAGKYRTMAGTSLKMAPELEGFLREHLPISKGPEHEGWVSGRGACGVLGIQSSPENIDGLDIVLKDMWNNERGHIIPIDQTGTAFLRFGENAHPLVSRGQKRDAPIYAAPKLLEAMKEELVDKVKKITDPNYHMARLTEINEVYALPGDKPNRDWMNTALERFAEDKGAEIRILGTEDGLEQHAIGDIVRAVKRAGAGGVRMEVDRRALEPLKEDILEYFEKAKDPFKGHANAEQVCEAAGLSVKRFRTKVSEELQGMLKEPPVATLPIHTEGGLVERPIEHIIGIKPGGRFANVRVDPEALESVAALVKERVEAKEKSGFGERGAKHD
jgi:hypothetical protein